MRIGEVARRGGVSVDTVRFYERRGLVAATGRTASGYREFSDDAAARIGDVKLLQALGLTLDDVSAVLSVAGDGTVRCRHVDGTLDAVVDRLDARIAELTAVRDRAVEARQACRDGSCPRAEGSEDALC